MHTHTHIYQACVCAFELTALYLLICDMCVHEVVCERLCMTLCVCVPCTAPLSCWFPLISGLSAATAASAVKQRQRTTSVGRPVKTKKTHTHLVSLCKTKTRRKKKDCKHNLSRDSHTHKVFPENRRETHNR